MQKFFLFFILLILVQSCSLNIPFFLKKNENLLIKSPSSKSLGEIANSFKSVKARCWVSVIIDGKPEPKVRGNISWLVINDKMNLRLTTFTPMNTTVFDALLINGKFFLAIPSEELVFVMAEDDYLPNNRKFVDVTHGIKDIFIPWVSIKYSDRISCPKSNGESQLMDCFLIRNSLSILGLKESDYAPIFLANNEYNVTFGEHLIINGAQYPQSFNIKFLSIPLEILVNLRDMEITHYKGNEEIFNPSPFFNMPFYPLSKHLNEISRSFKGESGAK